MVVRMTLITLGIGLGFMIVMFLLTPFIVDLFSLSSPYLVLIPSIGVVSN